MNGGVNGMMEESKELPHTDSPEKSHDSTIVALENTGINTKQNEIIDTELSNQEDSALGSAEDTNINLTKNLDTSNEDYGPKNVNQDKKCKFTVTSPETQDCLVENNSNDKSLEKHCVDSIGAYEEVADSPPKLEPSEHQKLLNQQCKEELLKDSEDSSSNNGSKEDADSHASEIQRYKEELQRISQDCSIYSNNGSKEDTDSHTSEIRRCKEELLRMSEDSSVSSNNGVSDVGEHQGDSENDDYSESGEPRPEETISINSDSEVDGQDESSQGSSNKINNEDETVLQNDEVDNQNGSPKECASPEVLEIFSDTDDDDDDEEQQSQEIVKETSVQLRRSNRAIKRKRYDNIIEDGGEISDLDEDFEGESLRRKSKALLINNTKTLAGLAAKQIKTGLQKKEPTLVIIDTNSISSNKGNSIRKPSVPSNNSTLCPQSLYQTIVSRGTTVTPVNNKPIVQNYNSVTSSNLLPSLTDDMFVVEAPSFIVPYVYEKPSIKPFREFVDNLGNELIEQRAKEEEEQKVKEQEKLGEENKEEKEKGEKIEKSDKEIETAKKPKVESEETEQIKREKRKERRRQRNNDDASWDGESEGDEDGGSDEEDKTIVIKDKADVIDDIKDVTDLTVEKVVTGKSDNYFDLSLGKFFMDIGLNLVQEFVQNDLLKQQNRKLYREKKGGHSTKITETSIASLTKNLEFSKEHNSPYTFKHQKCEFCTFKSESSLVLANHLETPHMKNSVYKCNFCVYESRSPHDILYHMEAEHNTRGKLERAPAYHQCANCPFEDNGKGKLARHLVSCAKKFKPELNLAPPIEWEPPAKIPKISRARNPMINSYQNAFHRGQVGNLGRPPMNNVMSSPGFRPRTRMPFIPRNAPMQAIPVLRTGVAVRHNSSSVIMPSNFPGNNGKNYGGPKPAHQPSISITPLPIQPQPVPVPLPTQQSKSTCVICEICDGYIKDLEQLRNHMQWIHKVKIHPKMIYNRPPLNCQKCQFRFFTDQGLERHLLGSHGLVTSSMQDAANKGKDAGRCPVCGRVYQWKLLTHVARDHSLMLKPAHLSYKCTVCTATFGMYKQFENHVYSAHSVVAKRVMDKGKTPPPVKAGQSLLKPLKINDEISIIPQPTKVDAPPLKDK